MATEDLRLRFVVDDDASQGFDRLENRIKSLENTINRISQTQTRATSDNIKLQNQQSREEIARIRESGKLRIEESRRAGEQDKIQSRERIAQAATESRERIAADQRALQRMSRDRQSATRENIARINTESRERIAADQRALQSAQQESRERIAFSNSQTRISIENARRVQAEEQDIRRARIREQQDERRRQERIARDAERRRREERVHQQVLRREIERTGQARIRSLGQSLGRGDFSGIVGQFADATLAIEGFGFAIAAAGRSIINTSADYQRLSQALRAITGDAASARAQLESIEEISQLPGITFQDAAQTSLRLRASGFDRQTTDRLIREFGNVAATSGALFEDAREALRQLTQIQSTGRFTAENLNQILERLPSLRPEIIRQFGTTVGGELQKVLERRGTSFDQAIDQLLTGLEQQQRVSADTFSNAVSNFQNAMNRLQRTMGENLIPVLTRLVNALTTVVDFLGTPAGQAILAGAATGLVAGAGTRIVQGVGTAVAGAGGGLGLRGLLGLGGGGAAAAAAGTGGYFAYRRAAQRAASSGAARSWFSSFARGGGPGGAAQYNVPSAAARFGATRIPISAGTIGLGVGLGAASIAGGSVLGAQLDPFGATLQALVPSLEGTILGDRSLRAARQLTAEAEKTAAAYTRISETLDLPKIGEVLRTYNTTLENIQEAAKVFEADPVTGELRRLGESPEAALGRIGGISDNLRSSITTATTQGQALIAAGQRNVDRALSDVANIQTQIEQTRVEEQQVLDRPSLFANPNERITDLRRSREELQKTLEPAREQLKIARQTLQNITERVTQQQMENDELQRRANLYRNNPFLRADEFGEARARIRRGTPGPIDVTGIAESVRQREDFDPSAIPRARFQPAVPREITIVPPSELPDVTRDITPPDIGALTRSIRATTAVPDLGLLAPSRLDESASVLRNIRSEWEAIRNTATQLASIPQFQPLSRDNLPALREASEALTEFIKQLRVEIYILGEAGRSTLEYETLVESLSTTLDGVNVRLSQFTDQVRRPGAGTSGDLRRPQRLGFFQPVIDDFLRSVNQTQQGQEREAEARRQQIENTISNIGRSAYQQFGADSILDLVGIGGRQSDRVNDILDDLREEFSRTQAEIRSDSTLSERERLDELKALNEQYQREVRAIEERSEKERLRAWRDWVKNVIVDTGQIIFEQLRLQLASKATNAILNAFGSGGGAAAAGAGAGVGQAAGTAAGAGLLSGVTASGVATAGVGVGIGATAIVGLIDPLRDLFNSFSFHSESNDHYARMQARSATEQLFGGQSPSEFGQQSARDLVDNISAGIASSGAGSRGGGGGGAVVNNYVTMKVGNREVQELFSNAIDLSSENRIATPDGSNVEREVQDQKISQIEVTTEAATRQAGAAQRTADANARAIRQLHQDVEGQVNVSPLDQILGFFGE